MSNSLSIFLMGMGAVFLAVVALALGFYALTLWGPNSQAAVSLGTQSGDSGGGGGTQYSEVATPGTGEGTPFVLSETQKGALSMLGIDPASIPSIITPEQEACFVTKLGADRVAEIKAGASPTATDFFSASSCL